MISIVYPIIHVMRSQMASPMISSMDMLTTPSPTKETTASNMSQSHSVININNNHI